jgi:hypothetical protein
MDKIKLVLDFFKKYLFWFIFATTIVLVLVCWWMSTASLAKTFQQEQVKIKKKFDEVKAIDDNKQHPTKDYIDAVNKKNQTLKEGVLKVWEALYNDQKKNNPWPKEVLGESAADEIGKLGPNDTIPYNLRERYQNYIQGYFPVLYKIIDLRQKSETGETGGGGNAGPLRQFMGRIPFAGRSTATADSADMTGMVEWDENDRMRLREHFNWKTRPDSDVIRLRQEDLWVYKTLLEVIRDTKKDAADHSQASVKRIEWIQIGADAIGSWSAADQSVFKAGDAAAASLPQTRGVTPAPGRGGDTAAAADSKEQLLKERYVDEKGVPLEAEAKPPYSEFKMMPISVKLHMDQRKISQLLAACIVSPMPIEVRRVRIRPGVGGELLEAGTSGAASPAASTGYGRRTVTAPNTSRSAGGGTGGEDGGGGSYDIPVEIQGVIYIYNEPDKNTLGTGSAAEKPPETPAGAAPAADAGAPGATPDATPAKPAETPPAKP